MKIVSWNVNGLRACAKNGFLDFVKKENPDIICLQEIKCCEKQIPKDLQRLGYKILVNSAGKKGYSGIAIFTCEEPTAISDKLSLLRFDNEGRFLRLDFKDFILINIYLPHGGRDQSKLAYKLESYQKLLSYLGKIKNKKVILAGDFNVAHTELDLARPKQNVKNIMFTPEERKQLDKLENLGFADIFRSLHPEGGHYTWWPYMANARERNLGWRIDYIFTSKLLTLKLKNAFILPKAQGSDHCPIGVEIND